MNDINVSVIEDKQRYYVTEINIPFYCDIFSFKVFVH